MQGQLDLVQEYLVQLMLRGLGSKPGRCRAKAHGQVQGAGGCSAGVHVPPGLPGRCRGRYTDGSWRRGFGDHGLDNGSRGRGGGSGGRGNDGCCLGGVLDDVGCRGTGGRGRRLQQGGHILCRHTEGHMDEGHIFRLMYRLFYRYMDYGQHTRRSQTHIWMHEYQIHG